MRDRSTPTPIGAWQWARALVAVALAFWISATGCVGSRARPDSVSTRGERARYSAEMEAAPASAPSRGAEASADLAEGPLLQDSAKAAPLGVTGVAPAGQTGAAGGGAASGGSTASTVEPPAARRMVVYQGWLELRVKHLRQALDAAVAMTEGAGGYVDALTERAVIVRVPGGDFERVLDLYATLGHVLDRRVAAHDVTARYRDLALRLDVARAAHERLVALLESASKAEERLAILREIKRLSTEIAAMESTLSTLKNLVDFYTITLEFIPASESGGPPESASPFPWVRALSPFHATLPRTLAPVLATPAGFVRFEREVGFRAQAADSSTCRTGVAPNQPRADTTFWVRAIEHELEARDLERVEAAATGGFAYRIYKDRGLQPSFYLVGLAAEPEGERVRVVEVFFPTEEAWQTHRAAVEAALAAPAPQA